MQMDKIMQSYLKNVVLFNFYDSRDLKVKNRYREKPLGEYHPDNHL
jgi:hypothetical protein